MRHQRRPPPERPPPPPPPNERPPPPPKERVPIDAPPLLIERDEPLTAPDEEPMERVLELLYERPLLYERLDILLERLEELLRVAS